MSPLRLLAVFAFALVLSAALRADDEPKADLKKLEATMDRALKAFNEGDHKKFWAEFAKAADPLKTPEVFKALYLDGYQKTFGKYNEKSTRKFLEKRSALTGETILAMWQGEFEKNKKALIAANFQKEGNDYKLIQIQVHEFPKDEDK